jgi:hypothetical protein
MGLTFFSADVAGLRVRSKGQQGQDASNAGAGSTRQWFGDEGKAAGFGSAALLFVFSIDEGGGKRRGALF